MLRLTDTAWFPVRRSSGEPEHQAAVEQSRAIRADWTQLLTLIEQRIRLGLKYTTFHKKAQQVRPLSLPYSSGFVPRHGVDAARSLLPDWV